MRSATAAHTVRAEISTGACRHRSRLRGGRIAAALFFGIIAILLISTLGTIDWTTVGRTLASYEPATLVAAGLLAVLGHIAAGSYDVIGRRHVGSNLSAWRTFVINFIAYTFSTNLGAFVGGWGARMRLYLRSALHARQVFRIIVFSIVTNWSGFILLSGVVLLAWPPQLPQWSPARASAQWTGAALLGLVCIYLWLCAAGPPKKWMPRLHTLSLDPPRLGTAMLQLALSSTSWLLLAATLARLLPPDLSFPRVLAVLLLASLIGAVTHVPGNLGVLEASVVLSIGSERSVVLAALIAFRTIYYLVPLTIAAAGYAVLEMAARHRSERARPLRR